MANKFISALLLLLLFSCARADMMQPGHILKQFMFTNLDKFPGFTYSFLHHGYHYNMGYQPDPVDTLAVENNNRYAVSKKGSDRSVLLARDKSGRYAISDIKLGGAAIISPTINGIVEVYTIISIKNKKIKLKKIKEIVVYADGTEKERKGGGLGAWIGSDGFASVLAIASTGALLGLLLLFIFRKRKPKYIQLTA